MKNDFPIAIEYDPNGFIAETIKFMLHHLDATADKIPDYLLKELTEKTDMNNSLGDINETLSLFLNVYCVYKGFQRKLQISLSTQEINELIQAWHFFLGLESLRRKDVLRVECYKIFDFDNILDREITLSMHADIMRSLMN